MQSKLRKILQKNLKMSNAAQLDYKSTDNTVIFSWWIV